MVSEILKGSEVILIINTTSPIEYWHNLQVSLGNVLKFFSRIKGLYLDMSEGLVRGFGLAI